MLSTDFYPVITLFGFVKSKFQYFSSTIVKLSTFQNASTFSVRIKYSSKLWETCYLYYK